MLDMHSLRLQIDAHLLMTLWLTPPSGPASNRLRRDLSYRLFIHVATSRRRRVVISGFRGPRRLMRSRGHCATSEGSGVQLLRMDHGPNARAPRSSRSRAGPLAEP